MNTDNNNKVFVLTLFHTNVLAQKSSGTKGVLGPTKIYLAVQPPDSPQNNIQKTSTVTTTVSQIVSKPIESSSLPQVPYSEQVNKYFFILF